MTNEKFNFFDLDPKKKSETEISNATDEQISRIINDKKFKLIEQNASDLDTGKEGPNKIFEDIGVFRKLGHTVFGYYFILKSMPFLFLGLMIILSPILYLNFSADFDPRSIERDINGKYFSQFSIINRKALEFEVSLFKNEGTKTITEVRITDDYIFEWEKNEDEYFFKSPIIVLSKSEYDERMSKQTITHFFYVAVATVGQLFLFIFLTVLGCKLNKQKKIPSNHLFPN